jgi:hypothetical protein
MQDHPNRRQEKQRMALGAVDSGRAVVDAIRQAFLTHMGEQQRQFPMTAAAKSPIERVETKKR